MLAQEPEPPPCAECVVLVLDPSQAVVLREPLNRLQIVFRVSQRETAPALAAREAIRAGGGVPGLLVTGVPGDPLPDAAVAGADQVFFDISGDEFGGAAADTTAFLLKTRFTELRGAAPSIRLGFVATAEQRKALIDRDIAPYVDVIGEAGAGPLGRPSWPAAGEPYAFLQAPDDWARPTDIRGRRWLWKAPPDALDAHVLAADLGRAMPLLTAELVSGGAVRAACGGQPAATYLNPGTLETIAIARGCGAAPIEIQPAGSLTARAILSNGDAIVRIAPAEGVFADDVRVVGARQLTVEEIIARHQAAAARQETLVRTRISAGHMTIAFEAPGFAAPVAISSETIIYAGGGATDIEQRSIRVNGLEFKGGSIPRLPIIEPERVASPPLMISLTDVYRYELVGRDSAAGVACYVVSFAPIQGGGPPRTLYRGRAWIAADTFAMVKVASVQTGLRGPIVSSEQVDEFAPHAGGIWLLARSEIHQVYEGAGHRTPIHRVLTLAAHDVNPPDFLARRAAAYASPSVMLRDTPEGFRYLRRDRGAESSAAAQPVVAGAAERVRTLALGLIVDPNISRPLPFAGLSYVDFNLLDTGTQVNAFFGGTYAQLAFSVPSVGGTGWQLAGRAFGIATSYNDRAFDGGREIYERNISQRPAHASVWTVRPLSPRVGLRAGYELDYTQFSASDSTASSFTVPADQVAHSLRLALEGQRSGWTGTVWWAGSRRAGWRPWGAAADYLAGHDDYQRYGVTLTRPIVVGHALVARIEGAWMDGRDLDRFSRYSFGTFDNRLRGYPSALIRYDRGAVLRTAAAWAAGRRFRVDGFFDTAYVHDRGFGPGLRGFSGIGAAIEAPAPFGLLTAVEWGYGFQGVNTSGRRGTQVVRVSAFKIF